MKEIAIIGGGGAGLLCAWMLQEKHSVVVYEEESFFGGHARSIPIATEKGVIWADTGFRYFFPHNYPIFTGVLRTLGVPIATRPAGMSFSDGKGERTLTVPPTNFRTLLRLLTSPRNLLWASSFYWVLRSGLGLVAAQDWEPSLEEYLKSRKIPASIYENYLVPSIASFWGAPISSMFHFPAYDVLRVMQQGKFGNPTFCYVDGGGTAYIEALRKHSSRVRFEQGAPIRHLQKKQRGWMVQRDTGEEGPFAEVIVATPSYVVQTLLGAHPLAQIAAQFEHFDTRIVIHRDPTQMPRERFSWTNLNVRFDGTHAWTTEWVGRDWDMDVFRTWLPPGHSEPARVETRRAFRHLLVDGKSRERQIEIAQLQGRDGVHLAGMYTCDVDNHESVALSAVRVAERLSPESPQLAALRKEMANHGH